MKNLYPVVNIGTAKDPWMVLCGSTMIMMYEKSTGKKFSENRDDFLNYCDGYRDAYNENLGNEV